MNTVTLITVISLVVAVSNGIATIIMYLRYVQVVRGSFAVLKATADGEIEITDLLADSMKRVIR
jgi:hypothetical protein